MTKKSTNRRSFIKNTATGFGMVSLASSHQLLNASVESGTEAKKLL